VGVIPSASASRALRLAIPHSFVHLGLGREGEGVDEERPQRTGCLIRPQGQVTVINDEQASVSGQLEGA
jgi:hypothetical protein